MSSAGKYEKVTVGGGASARSAELGHLAPDTAYELKLQSYTAQAPSDFSSILVIYLLTTEKSKTLFREFHPCLLKTAEDLRPELYQFHDVFKEYCCTSLLG